MMDGNDSSAEGPPHLGSAYEVAKDNRRVTRFAMLFALGMILAGLALPFIGAQREPALWPSLLQLALLGVYGFCWFYLGDAAEQAGRGVSFAPRSSLRPRPYPNAVPQLLYLLLFVPAGFAYVYVAYLNTGYLGFNYVLLFILPAFSVYLFPMRWVAVIILALTGGWALVAKALWGGWIPLGDAISTLSGYLFSAMMFYLLGKERASRARTEALSEDLDAVNEKLREYSGKVEELAATQERNRIAREIHDTLGHSLTVVNMQLETARALLERDPGQAAAFLEKAQTMTKRGLNDIRSSVASLRASPLNGKSLEESIEALLEPIRAAGLKAALRLQGEPRELRSSVKNALYRCVQEGLTNIRKHAQATNVRLDLDYRSRDEIEMILRDDGVGCAEPCGGFGLVGIRERIQMLEGETRIESAPGGGLTLAVRLKR